MQLYLIACAFMVAFVVHFKKCKAATELTWVGLYEIGEHHVEHWSQGDKHEDEHENEHEDRHEDEEEYHMYTVAFFPNNGSAFTQETVRFGCGKLNEHAEEEDEHHEAVQGAGTDPHGPWHPRWRFAHCP